MRSSTVAPEALKRPEWPRPAASAAIFRGDTVLIVERGKGALPGTWSLPGGHIEPGETALDAAAREVGEETGLSVILEGLVDVHDAIFLDADGTLRAHYVLAVFRGHSADGEPVAATDVHDARFVPISDIDGFRMTPGAQEIIRRAYAQSRPSAKP
ncbi:MAG: NUDIX hydrolase [Hyphomicrobiaceae bacterium]